MQVKEASFVCRTQTTTIEDRRWTSTAFECCMDSPASTPLRHVDKRAVSARSAMSREGQLRSATTDPMGRSRQFVAVESSRRDAGAAAS